MSPIKIIKYHTYLLQLESYDLKRFLRVVLRRPQQTENLRQKLVWTPKLAVVFTIAVLLQILIAYFITRPLANSDIYLGFFPSAFLLAFVLLSFGYFVFLGLATLILRPVDYAIKQSIVMRAKNKLDNFRDLKIIAITGSYGKTTMKEVLATILTEKFNILKTPESVNTPVGISRLILKRLNPAVEVFIVEMGAYQKGDIKALCEIARPDIAILSGINEAHLERFGTIENTIRAKFEIVENAREDAVAVLNQDNERVMGHYKSYAGPRKIYFYSKDKNEMTDYPQVPILGDYIWGVINACVIIARELGMSDAEIRSGIANIKPIPHRLQLIENPNGVTVIDDSYNGNPDGVREAIKVLEKFAGKRKIYITPGLVEMGERTREIHNEIGRQLAGVADMVIFIKNSVTPFIAEKINPEKIIWFDSTQEAHNSLGNILKPGDVVLFQNDWPDNYF